jgi:hypothetical protein
VTVDEAPIHGPDSLPEDVRVEGVDANGVAAEWTTTPLADPSRVILFLHGGGRAAPQALLPDLGTPDLQGLHRPRHSHAPTLLSDQTAYRSVVRTPLPHRYVTVTTPLG